MERSNGVPEEPYDDPNVVLISVRHVNLGLQSRSFPSNGSVGNIYEWVGSLDTYPENVHLFKMPREELSPNNQISTAHRCTLYMETVEDPILLCRVGEVSVQGYAVIEKHDHIKSPASPQQSGKVQEMQHHNYEGHLLQRDDVLNQLLKLYKNGLVDTSKIAPLRFEGKDGSGDCVTCKVFSSFWDEFYSTFFEGCGQCVPILTVQLSDNDFIANGMIITHMFVSFQIFAVRLSEALFQYCFLRCSSNVLWISREMK